MNRIIAIGESAYDILFKDNKPIDGKVGGAIVNTAISLGRLGTNIFVVGNCAQDQIGLLTIHILNENNVNTSFFKLNSNFQSRISLAFLDNPDNPNYLFYSNQNKITTQIEFPPTLRGDIILVGSIFAIKKEHHSLIFNYLKKAKREGALLIYDPNFRKNHLDFLNELKPNIMQNIEIADIIKGSDEDFQLIFQYKTLDEVVANLDPNHVKVIFYTQGKDAVLASILGKKIEFPIQQVDTVSAVGAGDSFNAGLIYELNKKQIARNIFEDLNHSEWKVIANTAIKFAAHVCTSSENYISVEFAKNAK